MPSSLCRQLFKTDHIRTYLPNCEPNGVPNVQASNNDRPVQGI